MLTGSVGLMACIKIAYARKHITNSRQYSKHIDQRKYIGGHPILGRLLWHTSVSIVKSGI